MDAFYASVEQRDCESLRNQPVIVGAPPERRGVVCTASYEARAFGVHSAMSSRHAAALCPQGIFIRPRMDVYRKESHAIMHLLSQFGGSIEQVSVDEAYLDMSVQIKDLDSSEIIEMGQRMKNLILQERNLPASIGIGSNKLLAKIASDHGKPNGLFYLSDQEKIAFLRPLPAKTIHGVGKVTADVLAQAGLQTIGDIQDHSADLRALVGSFGPILKRYAMGEDDRPLDFDGEIKSVSAEETFEKDTADRQVLVPVLKEQAEELALRLRKEHKAARTIQVKVRYSDFKTITRQITIGDPIQHSQEIYNIACVLLRKERLVNRPLRLLGLGVSNLSPPSTQQTFPF